MRYFLIIVFWFSFLKVNAQFTDPALSFSVEPVIGNRIMVFKSSYSKSFKDSINKADKWRDALSANISLSYSTSKYSRLFIGLQFMNFGFTRMRYDLKFKDTIHPDIGIVNDLSQTGSNNVEFNYRYQYIALPVLFSSRLHIKKMKTSRLFVLFGASVCGLIHHDIRTRLIGFSAKGKKVFKLNGDEDDPMRFNANLHFGFRLENPVFNKNTFVFVQPGLYLPILSANRSDMRAQLYTLGLQIGVMFQLKKDKA